MECYRKIIKVFLEQFLLEMKYNIIFTYFFHLLMSEKLSTFLEHVLYLHTNMSSLVLFAQQFQVTLLWWEFI
jgi:hypothetical protein